MSLNKRNLEKICNFSVSDWHMITVIISHLKRDSIYSKPIAFISEKDLKDDFNFLLNKFYLNENEKKLFRKIPWYNDTKTLGICKNSTYIINGSYDYINKTNLYFDNISRNKIDKNITLINCYNTFNKNLPIRNILNSNDKLLVTTGIKEINSVFPEYV